MALKSVLLMLAFASASAMGAGAQGDVEGYAVVLPVDRGLLTKTIRSDYEMAPQTVTADGTHPLLLLFFKFKNVRPSFTFVPPVGFSYSSLYVLVPYCRVKGDTRGGDFSVMPIGLMDNKVMVQVSRAFNGLPKEFAEIKWGNGSFQAYQDGHQEVDARFFDGGTLLKLAEIKKMIDMPTLSDKPMGSHHYGSSRALIDWSNTVLAPKQADITLGRPFSGDYQSDAPLGAFFFKGPFKVGEFSYF